MEFDGSRRAFVSWVLATASLAWVLACDGGAAVEEQAKRYDASLDCSDVSGLWPTEVEARKKNRYVDHSTTPGQHCFNCTNFEEASAPRKCGTCRTLKGPIQPLGWCTAWTLRRS